MQDKPETNEADSELQAPAHLGAPFPGSGYDYGRMGTRGAPGLLGLPLSIGLLIIAGGAVGHNRASEIVGGALSVMSLVLLVYFVRRESRRASRNPPGQVAEYLVRSRSRRPG
jgi:hypothetical protein